MKNVVNISKMKIVSENIKSVFIRARLGSVITTDGSTAKSVDKQNGVNDSTIIINLEDIKSEFIGLS